MELVSDKEPETTEKYAREMTRWEKIVSRIQHFFWCIRRDYIPYLVWYGDDIDVKITFTNIRLAPNCTLDNLRYEGDMETIWRAEEALHQLGLTFDTGTGCEGRDWEFDWSLRGDVKLAFRRKHKGGRESKKPRPELRLIATA